MADTYTLQYPGERVDKDLERAERATVNLPLAATLGAEAQGFPLTVTTALPEVNEMYKLYAGDRGLYRWTIAVTQASGGAFVEVAEVEPVTQTGGINLVFDSKYNGRRYAVTLTLAGGEVTTVSARILADLSKQVLQGDVLGEGNIPPYPVIHVGTLPISVTMNLSDNYKVSNTTSLQSLSNSYSLYAANPGNYRWAVTVRSSAGMLLETAAAMPVAVSGGWELRFESGYAQKCYAVILAIAGGTVTAVKTEYRCRKDQQKYLDVTNLVGYSLSRVQFDKQTGYWELNGLTDITDAEMEVIFERGNFIMPNALQSSSSTYPATLQGVIARTTIPGCSDPRYEGGGFARYSTCEVLNINTTRWGDTDPGNIRFIFTNSSSFLLDCTKLKSIINTCIDFGPNANEQLVISNAPLLETLRFQSLKRNINAGGAPVLSTDSILYWIENEAASKSVTWTLHADVYIRVMADARIQDALHAHPNIALASA